MVPVVLKEQKLVPHSILLVDVLAWVPIQSPIVPLTMTLSSWLTAFSTSELPQDNNMCTADKRPTSFEGGAQVTKAQTEATEQAEESEASEEAAQPSEDTSEDTE